MRVQISIRLVTALFLLFVSGLVEAGAEPRYAPVSVDMHLQQAGPHTYFVQGNPGMATEFEGFISNAGVVVTKAGVVVIDALGSPSLAYRMLTEIRKLTDQPVVKVITTHYHADHILGLQVFKELGAEIIAPNGAQNYLNSPLAKERLEERQFSLDPWVNEQTYLVKPDRYVDKTDSFSVGGVDFELTVVGDAHSDGDMTVYVKTDKVLYSGDVIFEGRVPFLGSANTKHWLAVLKQMDSSQLNALVPGHGAMKTAPVSAIGDTYRYLAFMREKMGAAVQEMTPFAEAYDAVDWSEFSRMPAFEAANRRNAYQVYLSMEAEMLAGE